MKKSMAKVLDVYNKLMYILNTEQKRYGLFLLAMSFVGALLETIGVSAIVPLIQVLMTPDRERDIRQVGAPRKYKAVGATHADADHPFRDDHTGDRLILGKRARGNGGNSPGNDHLLRAALVFDEDAVSDSKLSQAFQPQGAGKRPCAHCGDTFRKGNFRQAGAVEKGTIADRGDALLDDHAADGVPVPNRIPRLPELAHPAIAADGHRARGLIERPDRVLAAGAGDHIVAGKGRNRQSQAQDQRQQNC